MAGVSARTPRDGALHALGPEAAALAEQFTALRQENEALGNELLRYYEQLNLLFEITENIGRLGNPEAIQNSLLRRFGETLGAAVLLIDHGGAYSTVELTETLARPLEVDAARVHASLAQEIQTVRQTRRALVPGPQKQIDAASSGTHVLLAALSQRESDADVVIALRHPEEPAFDSSDLLATESALGYGGHILANALMVRDLQQMAVETVRALANAIDAKDNYTCGHSERVGWLARLTGQALGLPEQHLQVLEWAGILHDVGKIGVSDKILNKPGRLTKAELAEMQRHPRLSYEVLKPVARLGPALDAVLYHHENWDGSGYPEGLRGEQIPLFARIVRVADTFDALTSTRSYRTGFTLAQALKVLEEEAGRSIDPDVTRVFIRAFMRYKDSQRDDFGQRFVHVAGKAGAIPVMPTREPETGDASGAGKSRKQTSDRPAERADVPGPAPAPPVEERLGATIADFRDWITTEGAQRCCTSGADWSPFCEFLRNTLKRRFDAMDVRIWRTSPNGCKLEQSPDADDTQATESAALPPAFGRVMRCGEVRVGNGTPATCARAAKPRSASCRTADDPSGEWNWLLPLRVGGRTCALIAVRHVGEAVRGRPAVAEAIRNQLELLWSHVASLQDLSRNARIDHQSGMLNRADLIAELETVVRTSVREGEPVQVMVLAVEGLRQLDDAGCWADRDALVRRLAALLHNKVRSDDLLGRFSDDRFVIVLRRVDSSLGAAVAEKLMDAVRTEVLDVPAGHVANALGASVAESGPRLRAGLAGLVAPANGPSVTSSASAAGTDRPRPIMAATGQSLLERAIGLLDYARTQRIEFVTDRMTGLPDALSAVSK